MNDQRRGPNPAPAEPSADGPTADAPRARGDLLGSIQRQVGAAAFESLYGPLAPFYDRIASFFFAGQWAVWRRAALDHVAGEDVLEIGHGTGELLLELCRRGLRPYGLDLSPAMRAITRRKLKREGCAARLLRGDAAHIPLPDAALDVVVSTFPSGYILRPETWREVHRVLRPGGVFVVVLSGRLLPWDRRSRLLDRFHSAVYGERDHGVELDAFAFHGFALEADTRTDDRGVAELVVARRSWEGERHEGRP